MDAVVAKARAAVTDRWASLGLPPEHLDAGLNAVEDHLRDTQAVRLAVQAHQIDRHQGRAELAAVRARTDDTLAALVGEMNARELLRAVPAKL